jgi:hypothetical protein
MGATSPEPAPQSHAERLFPYSNPEPWSWIPGTWIHAGNIFVAGDGRFYRFVERTDEGWVAEEIEPSAVGSPARIAEITEVRRQYELTLAVHDELDQKMRDGEDTPEARAFLSARDEELHHLRDELILLCNSRSLEARAARKPDQEHWKLTLVGVLAAVLPLSLIYCVKSLVEYDRNVAGAILAGTLFVISGAVLSVIGVRELARRKNRLVTGNLVGCWALVTLAVIAAAFGILFYVVFMYYSSMARPH